MPKICKIIATFKSLHCSNYLLHHFSIFGPLWMLWNLTTYRLHFLMMRFCSCAMPTTAWKYRKVVCYILYCISSNSIWWDGIFWILGSSLIDKYEPDVKMLSVKKKFFSSLSYHFHIAAPWKFNEYCLLLTYLIDNTKKRLGRLNLNAVAKQ